MSDPNWPAWACPEHRVALDEEADELVCPRAHSFPRVDGVARFVEGATYADAFGTQWNAYRLAQLDSHTNTSISRLSAGDSPRIARTHPCWTGWCLGSTRTCRLRTASIDGE